jgi:hypothetical protein
MFKSQTSEQKMDKMQTSGKFGVYPNQEILVEATQ